MKRYLLIAAVAAAYLVFRLGVPAATPTPVPTPATPFPAVAAVAAGMGVEDRNALAQAYSILARAVTANTVTEPVFPDTAAVRRAHRAALAYVWQAVLQNKPGEVEGLREALEKALADRIGTDDVPLNPELQKDTAAAFFDLSASFR